jgi:hypothetical protein
MRPLSHSSVKGADGRPYSLELNLVGRSATATFEASVWSPARLVGRRKLLHVEYFPVPFGDVPGGPPETQDAVNRWAQRVRKLVLEQPRAEWVMSREQLRAAADGLIQHLIEEDGTLVAGMMVNEALLHGHQRLAIWR